MTNGWQKMRLGEVCEFINGLWKGDKPPFVQVGVFRNTNFTKNGTLEVRVADVGVAQHAYVWSFDTNRLHGSYKNAISTVSFTDGVLSVEATGAETWRSSDETYKDALLEIDPEGNLRIVTMNGDKKDVIWNSKYDS